MPKSSETGTEGEGKAPREPRSRAEQVRAAVEQAFGATAQGTAPVRERAQELADELVGAASRVREVLEELRPPSYDEVEQLRERVAALERRVAELESSKGVEGGEAAKGTEAAEASKRAEGRQASKGGEAAEAAKGAESAKGVSASTGASTAKRGPAAKKASTAARKGGAGAKGPTAPGNSG